MPTGTSTPGNDNFIFTFGELSAVIDGGAGVDKVFISWPRAGFVISPTDLNGITTISSASGGGESFQLKNIEQIVFRDTTVTLPQFIAGDAANNTLIGGAGVDILFGKDGSDTLTGGGSGDQFRYSSKTESTAAAFDTITDFQSGDAVEFFGMSGVRLLATQFQFQSTLAATIAAIASNTSLVNAMVSFTDGTDGWLYVRGAGGGIDFDGTLIKLQGRTTLLGAADIMGESGTFTLPTLALAATSASKAEGSGTSTPFTFTVTRTGDLSSTSTVLWSVAGSGGSPADATDFQGGILPSGTLSFAATETSKVITVNVNADNIVEADEGFSLTLATPSGAILGIATASGLINNDDFGKTVNLQAYSWKSHTLLDAVSVQVGNNTQISNAAGAASFDQVPGTTLSLTATRSTSAAESQAVNLQDAIAILKMIVGLEVNGVGKPLSAYQALAADYDANGVVNLNDAIGVLKHVVGLDAPQPTWHFLNESDLSVPARATLNPGTFPANVSANVSGTSPVHVGLVGILSGDVDGSFAGVAGALDLDVTQASYFTTLTQTTGLNLAQFGIYA